MFYLNDLVEISRVATIPSSYYGRQGIVTRIGRGSYEVTFRDDYRGDVLWLMPSEIQKVPLKNKTIKIDGVEWGEYVKADKMVNVDGVDYVQKELH